MKLREITKKCTICGGKFTTRYKRQNICSFKCQQVGARERSLIRERRKRKNRKNPNCEICGFNEVIDVHHEFGLLFYLCPNHHEIITRNGKTIKDLWKNCELKYKKLLSKKLDLN